MTIRALYLRRSMVMDKEKFERLSPSSRFNLRFMRRTNVLAIIIFTIGVIYTLIRKFVLER